MHHTFQMKRETVLLGAFFLLIATLATLPYLNTYLVDGHDLSYHLARIEGIYYSMASGHKIVHINPIQISGYGYASGILYPQLFLYFPAFLRFLGISLTDAYKMFIFGINLATVVVSYFSIKGMTKCSMAGVIGAALYVLSIYRLNNIYARAALGEVLAMTFLPLVAYGMYEVLQGDCRKWIWLTIGYTGIIQSHILSVLMSAFFCVLAVLMSVKKLAHEKKRFANLILAAVCTVLLNIWFIFPFLQYYMLDLNFKAEGRGLWKTATSFSQMFTNFLAADIGMNQPPETTKLEMIQSVGMLLLFAGILFVVSPKKNGENRKDLRRIQWGVFGFAVLSIWMSSIVFPWKAVMDLERIGGIAATVQFTWRFLGYATLFLCITGAEGITEWIVACVGEEEIERTGNRRQFAVLLVIFAAVVNCQYFLDSTTQMNAVEVQQDCASIGIRGSDELYLYKDDAVYKLEQRAGDFTVSQGTEFTYSDYERYGCRLLVQVDVVKADENAYLEVPLYYYPNYKAWIDGQETEIYRGTDGVIRIPITEGTWNLEVDFVEAPLWIIGGIVSFCSFGGLTAWGILRRRRFQSAD